MLKRLDSKEFYDGVKSGFLSSYRDFRKQVIDKNFRELKNKKNNDLAVLQRSAEFFLIRNNILNFIKFKNNKNHNFIFPYSWYSVLSIKLTNKVVNHILFCFYVFKLSIRRILGSIFIIIFKSNSNLNFNTQDTVYLHSIPENTLNNSKDQNKYSLVYWLNDNIFKKKMIYLHSNKNMKNINTNNQIYLNSYLPPISLFNKIKILVFFIPYFMFSFLKLTIGMWKKFYMMDDFLIQEYFKKSNPSCFIKSYIFPYIGTQFRPSWTNEVIKNGCKIFMINYSSSSQPSLNGKLYDDMLFRISDWQYIIPFNKTFVPVIKKSIIFPSKVINSSTVLFSDNDDCIAKYVQKPFVSIFDISPIKAECYLGITCLEEYINIHYDKNILFHERFFYDLIEMSKKYNLQLVLKPKRHDNRITSNYQKMLLNMEKQKDLIILPYQMSPYKVVDQSIASVVQPFSSVGFYNDKDANVIFYDPLEVLPLSHQEDHNNTLIISKQKLDNWFKNLKNSILNI